MLVLLASTSCSSETRPDILIYETDDLNQRLFDQIDRLEAIARRGTTLSSITIPICSPSRISLMTGMHGHNHRMVHNRPNDADQSRWDTYYSDRTIAARLKGVGYGTIWAGKQPNALLERDLNGWDSYFGPRGGGSGEGYWLDELTRHVGEAIAGATQDQPLFVYFSPSTPHKPFVPASKYLGTSSVPLPMPANFNEADTSDKRSRRAKVPVLDEEDIVEIAEIHRSRYEMMLSVVDSLSELISALEKRGRPTYVFFLSDNGFFAGEHRERIGKGWHFEETSRVPMFVIGPDVAPGTVDALVYNLDVTATVAELGGVDGSGMDGTSLLPLLRDHEAGWRKRALLECVGRYVGVRTKKQKLVNFAKNQREWYKLKSDPFELRNRCKSPSRPCAPRLASYLSRLATCQGRECWDIETE